MQYCTHHTNPSVETVIYWINWEVDDVANLGVTENDIFQCCFYNLVYSIKRVTSFYLTDVPSRSNALSRKSEQDICFVTANSLFLVRERRRREEETQGRAVSHPYYTMAPRGDDDGVVMMSHESVLSSSPASFSTDRFTKSLSRLSLDGRDSTSSIHFCMLQNSMPYLRATLQIISERGERLLGQVSDMEPSLIVEACNSSLQSEFLFMLDEAGFLLDTMETCSVSISTWRVSLAQVRVAFYLEAIETALKCPDRKKLDDELRSVASSISMKLNSNRPKGEYADEMPLRVSPWNISSLVFDLTVGFPVRPVKSRGLPLNLEIRAIQEVQAKDIFEGKSLSFRAYKIDIERCVYEGSSLHAATGTVGYAMVIVRVSPIDDENGTDAMKKEEWKQLVKEART